jgi:tetratricopeptide (TPR) repeat protein
MSDGDRAALVQLLATLGSFWMVRGEHTRLLVLADAVVDAIGDWQPPPELEGAMGAALSVTLANSLIAGGQRVGKLQAMLRRLDRTDDGGLMSGMATVMLTFDPADPGAYVPRLEELAADGDRQTAATACFWLSNLYENAGELAGSMSAAQRALELAGDDGGPWTWAMARSLLAQLSMHMGKRGQAITYARAALPVMHRLGATDDEIQLRCLLVFAAIADGQLAEAQAELDQIDLAGESGDVIGGLAFGEVGRAELLLARGDHAAGLSAHLDGMASLGELEFPGVSKTGLEPWVLFGASLALAAHAYYATGAEETRGWEMFRRCREVAMKVLSTADFSLDYPVVGQLLFALGTWALLRRAVPVAGGRPPGTPAGPTGGGRPAMTSAVPAPDAVRLLVLADRFAYNRAIPTLRWERIAATAEELAPGRIAEFQAAYADRRPADLLDEACRAVERLLDVALVAAHRQRGEDRDHH